MLKRTMTYTDYNGEKRTEDFFFNLTKAEIMEMAMSENGGLDAFIERIVSERDQKRIVSMFKQIILMAYGEKDLDGKHFVKSPAISTAFSQTEAYSDLFVELTTDGEKGAAFFNALIPADMDALAEKIRKAREAKEASSAAGIQIVK